jgi:uncharacterized membrane protein YhaH (DUF805 family)
LFSELASCYIEVPQAQLKGESDMNWYLEALRKFATFSGRARRSEYWYFTLFNLIIEIVLAVIDMATGLYSQGTGVGVLSGIFGIAMILPSIAVGIRRLHDTNRSGWWLLIGVIPLLGAIVLLIFMVLDSDAGENRFGPNPKSATA